MSMRTVHALRHSYAAAALVAGLALPSAAAVAAAQVSGSPQAVSIDAQSSSLKDILSALSKQFSVQFQSTANLDKPITGTYEGSLRRVVTRLLEGYNFILTSHDGEILVTVLGTQSPQQIAGAASHTAASAQPGNGQRPNGVKVAAKLAPNERADAAGANGPHLTAGQQHKSTKKGSPAPLPLLKVAEGGPAPVPAPAPAGTPGPGPMPGPATNALPQPKPAANGGPNLPMPAPVSANAPQLPIPTEVKPFPMSGAPTNAQPPAPPASADGAKSPTKP